MECKIFYSWQSDLPGATNRNFIENALENVIRNIKKDDSIILEPVLDRDTVGVPGSPDIANTIFEKIGQSNVFVCDVSIINQADPSRSTPNPNVLIELGYALKVLGTSRVILVVNAAYGGPELLPFDLKMRRAVVYNLPKNSEEKATQRKNLEGVLELALVTIIKEIEDQPKKNETILLEKAEDALENNTSSKVLAIRNFMQWLIEELAKIAPTYTDKEEHDETLLRSIDKAETYVNQFIELADIISGINSVEGGIALYQGFEPLLRQYNLPINFSGSFNSADFDFYKFIGHELFVSFISLLIKNRQWKLLSATLEEEIFLPNANSRGPKAVDFCYISDYVQLLEYRNKRLQLNQVSVHANKLNERHKQGPLSSKVPMDQFVDADLFLLIRCGLKWRSWSAIYLDGRVPRFLIEAQKKRIAMDLLKPLQVADIDMLRKRVSDSRLELHELFRRSAFFFPFEDFNIDSIGSRE